MGVIRADQLSEQLADDVSPVTELRASEVQALGNVVEIPRGELNLMDFLEVPPSLVKDWEAMGEINGFEQAQRYREGKTMSFIGNLIPGISAGIDITEVVKNTRALERIEKNEYGGNALQRNKDIMRVQQLMLHIAEEQVRGVSTTGKIMKGVIQIPAFVGGFALTKGLAKGAGLAASKAVSEAVARQLTASAAKGLAKSQTARIVGAGLKKSIELTAGAAVQTGAVGIGLGEIPREALNRQETSRFQFTDKGLTMMAEAQEKPLTSFMKATGSVYISMLTERAGEIFITPGLNALAKRALPSKIAANLVNLHKRMFPNKDVRRLMTTQGFDGFISEMGEEQLEKFLNATTGIQEFGEGTQALDRLTAAFGDGEAYLVEAGVISVGTGFQSATAHGVSRLKRSRDQKQVTVQEIEKSVVDGAQELLNGEQLDKIIEKPEVPEILPKVTPVKTTVDQPVVAQAKAVKKKVPIQEKAFIEKETAEDRALRESFEQTEQQVQVEQNLVKRVEAAKKKFKSPAAQAKAEVKEVQRELIAIIKDTDLETSDLGKFIKKPTQTLTVRQLVSKLPAIEQAVERQIEKVRQRREIARFKRTTAKTKIKKLRPEFKQPVLDIIENLDPVKKSSKKIRALTKLRDLLQSEEFVEANQIPESKLAELTALETIALRDMASEDIRLINDAVAHFIKLNDLKNKLLVRQALKDKEAIVTQALADFEASKDMKDLDGSIKEIDSAQDEISRSKLGKVFDGIFGVDSYNMELILELLDGKDQGTGFEVVYATIDQGVTEQLRFLNEGNKAISAPIKDIDVSRWSRAFQIKDSDVDTVGLKLDSGEKVNFTKGEMVALYLHSLNKQNTRHLVEGGFSFPGKLSKVVAVTAEDLGRVQELVENDPQLLKVAQTFNKYLNTTQKDAINKISLSILGFELALEDNYFRINVNPLGRSRQQEIKRGNYSRFLIESLGFLKPRLNTNNPIVLDDAFVVMTASVKQASAYVGLAQPLRTTKAFLFDNRVEALLRSQGRFKHLQNLRDQVEKIEGESIRLTDIDKITQDLINKADSAILGANPWVIAKQPISYVLSMTEMNPKYVVQKVPLRPSKKTLAEIEKHSPQLHQRLSGFISREVGEVSAVGEARHLFTGKQLLSQNVMAGIKAADTMAIGGVWLAARNEIADKKPDLKGDEFLEAVAKRAEEVVRRTQPTFHLKDRSAIASSRNWVVRLLTKYSSQRNKNWMMLRRAFSKYNRSHKTLADKADLASRVTLVSIISSMGVALVNMARDLVYDRDEEEKRMQNFLENTILTFLGNIYFVGPIASSIFSKVKKGSFAGYDVNDPLSSTIDELTNAAAEAVRAISQAIKGEVYIRGRKRGEEKWKTSIHKVYTNSLDAASKITGIPMGNARRLLEAGFKQTKKLLE